MKRTIQFVLCLLLSLGLMWWAFRLGNLKISDVFEACRQVNYWWLIPFVAITILGMYLRAVRWHYLLRPQMRLSSNQLFPPLMIGFALNGLLPFRAGEFARAYALKQRSNCPFSLGFGTVVLERVFDAIVLVALIALLLWLKPDIAGETIKVGDKIYHMQELVRKLSLMMAACLVFVILLLIPWVRQLAEKGLRVMPLPHRLKDKLVEMFQAFSTGMDSLRDVRLILTILFWTVLVWAAVGFSLQVMYYGFESQVADFEAMSFAEGMMICTIICVAIVIPSAPGYWGLYEIGGVLAFSAIGLIADPESPVPMSFTLIVHFFQMLPIILIGVYYMSRQNLSIREIMNGQRQEESKQ